MRIWTSTSSAKRKSAKRWPTRRARSGATSFFRHMRAKRRDPRRRGALPVRSTPPDARSSTRSSTTSPSAAARNRRCKRSEEKYRNIFNYASVGIYQSTLDGRFITANTTLAACSASTRSRKLLQRSLADDIYVDREQRDDLIRQFEPAAATPAIANCAGGARTARRCGCSSTRTPSSRRRATLYFEGFVYDITERKRTEETLRTQSAAMTASMDGIGIVNERLEFTYLNDALAKLYGFPTQQHMVGVPLLNLFDELDAERISSFILPIVHQRGRWARRDGRPAQRRHHVPAGESR